MPKLPSLKRADRYVHDTEDTVVILADGTLLDTEPVTRMIDNGLAIPTEWRKALDKTLSQQDA